MFTLTRDLCCSLIITIFISKVNHPSRCSDLICSQNGNFILKRKVECPEKCFFCFCQLEIRLSKEFMIWFHVLDVRDLICRTKMLACCRYLDFSVTKVFRKERKREGDTHPITHIVHVFCKKIRYVCATVTAASMLYRALMLQRRFFSWLYPIFSVTFCSEMSDKSDIL